MAILQRVVTWVLALTFVFVLLILAILAVANDNTQNWVSSNEGAAATLASIVLTLLGGAIWLGYQTLERSITKIGEQQNKYDDQLNESRKDWSSATREIESRVAAGARDAAQNADTKLEEVEKKIADFEQEHPWLRDIDPDFIALYSDNLDAVFHHACQMYRKGQANALAQWLQHITKEPNFQGSPESFIYMAEFAADVLRDIPLALKFIARHKQLSEGYTEYLQNPAEITLKGSVHGGVAAVELDLLRRLGRLEEAWTLARLLDAHLSKAPFEYVKIYPYLFGFILLPKTISAKIELRETTHDWREEVYLARFYFSLAEAAARTKANDLLRRSWERIPKRESKSELYFAAADLSHALGNTENVTRLAEEAIFADVNNLRAHLLLAEVMLSAGRFEDAAILAQNAQKIEPRSHLDYAAQERLNDIAAVYGGDREPPRMAATPTRKRQVWSEIMEADGVTVQRAEASGDYYAPPSSALLEQLRQESGDAAEDPEDPAAAPPLVVDSESVEVAPDPDADDDAIKLVIDNDDDEEDDDGEGPGGGDASGPKRPDDD